MHGLSSRSAPDERPPMTANADYDPYELPASAIQEPPVSLWAALQKIGPGIILAGTIVGSGELLLTTSFGARWGFVFLWLILYSCVIKVFVQTELGRYAISSGKPTLAAINELAGPRLGKANWILWCWLIMMLATTMQLGAMTGTVGQCLNLAFPQVSSSIRESISTQVAPARKELEEEARRADELQPKWEATVDAAKAPPKIAPILALKPDKRTPLQVTELAAYHRSLQPEWIAKDDAVKKLRSGFSGYLADEVYRRPELPWAVFTCVTALLLLWSGSYRRIELITTVLVVGITLATVTATMLLPLTPFPIHWDQVATGLTFQLPSKGIADAFAVFGITGVGAAELFFYPYWCLEKGYARYAGVRDNSEAWERRAKGWVRVMHLDAWVSMIVFTVSTVSFYFMGAAVLQPQGLDPKGVTMIATLSHMFADTFGGWTEIVFLIGAGAVLFKTLYLSAAGNGRLAADFMSLSGAVRYTAGHERARVIQGIALFIPVLALILFLIYRDPRAMVVVGGFAQALTLPIISGSAVYFRYRKLDRRLTPSLILDILLWIAFVSITIVAIVALKNEIQKFLPVT